MHCFVRCSFVRRSFFGQRVSFQRVTIINYSGGELRCRSIQDLTLCPVRLLVRLLTGFSLIELSVGQTGIRTAFIFNAEHRAQST
jgi:hypothetical protein